MEKKYITIVGLGYRYGSKMLEKGMKVNLEKEPDNEYDKEAIKVSLEGLGTIGYVANSPYTVKGESMSAGRLYDKIEDTCRAEVVYVFDKDAVCRVIEPANKKAKSE